MMLSHNTDTLDIEEEQTEQEAPSAATYTGGELAGLMHAAVAPWRSVSAMGEGVEHAGFGQGHHAKNRGDIAWGPATREATRAIMRILGDGMWHHRSELLEARRAHGAGREVVHIIYEALLVAESDSGKYLCIPREWTPTEAPDGT